MATGLEYGSETDLSNADASFLGEADYDRSGMSVSNARHRLRGITTGDDALADPSSLRWPAPLESISSDSRRAAPWQA